MYGGIERVVRDLDEEYTLRGHDSIVIASKNSKINGRLIPSIQKSTWKKEGRATYNTTKNDAKENFEAHCRRCLEVIAEEKPDAVHDHTNLVTSEAYENSIPNVPILTTVHGDFDPKHIGTISKMENLRGSGLNYFNGISESQRRIFKQGLSLDFTVFNGVATKHYDLIEEKDPFLFSIGKIDYIKGQDTAVRVARDLGKKLIIAGPIHNFAPHIKEYWENQLEPMIDEFHYEGIPEPEVNSFIDNLQNNPNDIIYIGEVDDARKKKWFGRSEAFLMPIRWEEPFGLVMTEAMACGTPVVAYDKGAVSEVLKHGMTGYIVKPEDYESFLKYTSIVDRINPKDCRDHTERFFDISVQADNYLKIFEKIKAKN